MRVMDIYILDRYFERRTRTINQHPERINIFITANDPCIVLVSHLFLFSWNKNGLSFGPGPVRSPNVPVNVHAHARIV